MSPPGAFGALVVGGGVNGLATAWHLARMGVPRVALVERFRLHHDRGSSHGAGRITRSTYSDARYVRLVRVAHEQEWPRLERESGRTLIHRADGIYFGPADGDIEQWAAAVASAGAPGVERIEAGEARRRFPQFAFPDAHAVLHDRTGGVVAAAETLLALDRLCRIEGVHVLEETRVLGLEPDRDPVGVDTDRGRLLAERVVVTAGAWVGQLVPSLAAHTSVERQHVGYFALAGPAERTRPGSFPVWVYLGGASGPAPVPPAAGSPPQRLFYGLPEFGRPGVKAARHGVSGRGDDPDDSPGPSPAAIEEVRVFLREQLAVRLGETLHAETCLYTNTPDEHFVIGALPAAPRVVVGSACSGHGFKFGPLTGRILAELAFHGRTSVPEFEDARATFAVPAG
ncbi:MAG TPA: N-methyl-L-tryptophan oxidase [Candidatus Eisenbacteria bacterium]